jgi:phenylacetyl-CoA:acceptor oxidoreductase subunit 2
VLAAMRFWAWRRYFNALESEGAPTRTLEIFSACRFWFFAAGLVLPVALVANGLFMTAADAALFAAAGLSVFATGWAIKFILITRAAYNQGFALPHTPIRGSGIPGPAVKPGWTLP